MSSDASGVPCAIKDIGLAEGGKRRIEWAFQSMPVLAAIRKHFIKTQAFSKIGVAALLPVSAAAANLIITLRDGGAKIAVCGSDAQATEDDVAASLVKDYLVPVFAVSGAKSEPDTLAMGHLLERQPQLLLDQTGELTAAIAESEERLRSSVLGVVVETRDRARWVRALARGGRLGFPVLASNASLTRRVFHSRIGGGQSALDVIIRSLNMLVAGINVVVVGFGAAGRGVAARAKGLGALVTVTEVDPIRALEAAMEGYRVLSMAEAATVGEIFLAASGSRNVIGREHFDKLRNGAILANAGHSDVEFDLGTLAQIVSSRRPIRAEVEELWLRDGRRIYLLAGGRSIHGAVGESYPASVLDLSFANRALSAEYLLSSRESLGSGVSGVPLQIDRQVARFKLEAMGIKIDRSTVEQEQYLAHSRD